MKLRTLQLRVIFALISVASLIAAAANCANWG